jgi:TetR/AcrR family transcriptional regulator, mexJK operon transcriptional repressor
MTATAARCPMRGRPPDPSKRAAIVAAAGALFSRQGYGISMEAIAGEANVSKQTIYNLFSTKEHLFGAVVASCSETIIEAIPTPAEHAPPTEGLSRIAHEYVRFMTSGKIPLVYRLMISAPSEVGAVLTAQFYDNGPRRALAQVADYLRDQDRLGNLKIANPDLSAECFFGMLNGQILIRNMLGLQDHWSEAHLDEKADYCVAMFLSEHAQK